MWREYFYFPTRIYSRPAFVHCFCDNVVLKAKEHLSSSGCLPSCCMYGQKLCPTSFRSACGANWAVSMVLFCPFPGCVHLFWPWVAGSSIIECPNSLEWRMLLKDKQMLKSMEKKAKDSQTLWLPCFKTFPPWQLELTSCSLCAPCPSQCQVGPPLWLQKWSFILSFISHYNALGSWSRLLSAILQAQQ